MKLIRVLLHELDQDINQRISFLLFLLQCMEKSKMMHNAGGRLNQQNQENMFFKRKD
jgi:hypothetical protein